MKKLLSIIVLLGLVSCGSGGTPSVEKLDDMINPVPPVVDPAPVSTNVSWTSVTETVGVNTYSYKQIEHGSYTYILLNNGAVRIKKGERTLFTSSSLGYYVNNDLVEVDNHYERLSQEMDYHVDNNLEFSETGLDIGGNATTVASMQPSNPYTTGFTGNWIVKFDGDSQSKKWIALHLIPTTYYTDDAYIHISANHSGTAYGSTTYIWRTANLVTIDEDGIITYQYIYYQNGFSQENFNWVLNGLETKLNDLTWIGYTYSLSQSSVTSVAD